MYKSQKIIKVNKQRAGLIEMLLQYFFRVGGFHIIFQRRKGVEGLHYFYPDISSAKHCYKTYLSGEGNHHAANTAAVR